MASRTESLNGKWMYSTIGKKGPWKTMAIPSNWEKAGLHDFSGVVWFKRKFKVQSTKYKIRGSGVGHRGSGRAYLLRFGGVDYFTDVWVNGKYAGSHEGYFQPFGFDITRQINTSGDNELLVKVSSPEESLKDWPHNKRYIKGVFGHHDIRPGSWSPNFGQMMGTGGIWNDVDLIVVDGVRIGDVKIDAALNGRIRASVEVENYTGRKVRGVVDLKIKESGKQKAESG